MGGLLGHEGVIRGLSAAPRVGARTALPTESGTSLAPAPHTRKADPYCGPGFDVTRLASLPSCDSKLGFHPRDTFAGGSLPPRLTASHGAFQVDGRPTFLLSGEMHYFRVRREHWE